MIRKLIFIIVLLPFLSCGRDDFRVACYVFVDFTDKGFDSLATSDIDKFFKILNVDDDDYSKGYGKFSCYPLTGSSKEHGFTSTLAPYEPLENTGRRKRKVESFKDEVEEKLLSMIDNFQFETLPRSMIYRPICEKLNYIAKKDTFDRKVVLIYSDMLDNSGVLNFYSSTGIHSIESELDSDLIGIIEKFENAHDCLIPNLSDLEIHIISSPSSWELDMKDQLAKKLWKGIFLSRGLQEGNYSFDSEIPSYVFD